MKFITNLKIKHKLQVTGILYLLLIVIVIYFFISSNALIKKSSEQQHSLNSLSADIQHLETAVKDYVYDSISINDLNQLFEQLGGRIKKTTHWLKILPAFRTGQRRLPNCDPETRPSRMKSPH